MRPEVVNAMMPAFTEHYGNASSIHWFGQQAKAMIDFFILEKAVYEVNYELTNRPGWVAIPLNGILRVLAKARVPQPAPA